MNSQIAEAFVRIRPDMRGFKSETEAGFNSAFRDAARSAAKIAGGVLAARGAVDVIKELTQAAAAHEAAFDVLDRTLRNAGLSAKGFSASLKDVLEQQARLKGFSAEELASSMVRLVSVTKNAKTALKDLGLAEDLARARHIDLAAAALALSKAEQGSTTALQRYGIVVPKVGAAVADLKKQHDQAVAAGAKFTGALKLQYDQALATATATDKAARRAEAFHLIQQRFGGASATFANSAAGGFARLSEDIHQLEISIGTGLLPTMTGAAEGLRKLAEAAAKSDIGPTLGRALHDVGQSLAFIAPLAQTAGDALLTFAKAAESVVSAVGAPALIAAFAVYKGIPLVMNLATAAQARYIAVASRGAGVTAADAKAKGADAAASDALSVSFAALTVALEANTAAMAQNVAGIEAVAGASVASTTAIEGTAAATTAGSVGLRAFGAGLLGLISPTKLLIAGAAALAGGIFYLATRESAAERATRSYRDALAELDKGLQNSIQLRQHLADLTKSTIPNDKLSIDQAKLTVEQDRYALSTTKAARGSVEYRQLVLNLQRDVQGLSDSLRNLSKDQADVAKTSGGIGSQARKTTADISTATQKIAGIREQVKQQYKLTAPVSGIDTPLAPALQAAQTQRRITDFFQQIQKTGNFNTPALKESVSVLQQFVNSVGRLPSNREIKLALTAKPGTLDEFLNKINGKGQAKGAGESAGASYSAGFASGVISGSGLVESAVAQMVARASSGVQTPRGSTPIPPLRRATGGYVPGAGDSDTVPALLTPQEIVLNKQQQRTLRVQLGMKQFGSAQELFNRINGGGGTGLPLFGPPVLSGAYNEIGSAKGAPVQKFAGGGVVPSLTYQSSGGPSDVALAPYLAEARSLIHRDVRDPAVNSSYLRSIAMELWRKDHRAGGVGLQGILGSTGNLGTQASLSRFQSANLAGQGGRVQPLVQPFIAGLGANLVAKLSQGRGVGAGDFLSTGGNLLGNLGTAGLIARIGIGKELLPLLARSGEGQMSLADIAGDQASMFERTTRSRVPRARHLTSLNDVVRINPTPVPGQSLYSTGVFAPSFWTGEDISAFPEAMRSGLDSINDIHGWPDYTRQRSLPLYMETGQEGFGHMRPGMLGRGMGLGVSHIAVRPDEQLSSKLGLDLLRDRTMGTLTHEFGHALDYGPLKPRPGSKFPGSVAAAMGHTGDPHWTNLWNALEQSPSIQRMIAGRDGLVASIANNGGWAGGLEKAQLENYDYLLNPAEIFARGYAQWIGERTQDRGIMGTLVAEFMATNAFPSAGRGEWVFADLPHSEAHVSEILDSVLSGNNPTFTPIANAFEQLFSARGLLRGDPIMRDIPAGARGTTASVGARRVMGQGTRMADVMSTRFAKTPAEREAAKEAAAAARRAIAASVDNEFFSHKGVLAPRIIDPAERAAIGFPDLPTVPKGLQRDIAREAKRIAALTFPKTDKMKQYTSAAELGLPESMLKHRLEQAIQGTMLTGERSPFWYEDQGPDVRGLAEREGITGLAAAQALSVTSAQAPPSPDNMLKAVLGIRQWQNIGADAQGLITGVQRRKIGEALRGEPWSTGAQKTSNFYQNLYTGAYGVDAAKAIGLNPYAVTNDVHVARGLWPEREDPGFENLGEYLLATEFNKSLQKIMGYALPMHGQASYWGGLRAISELSRPVGKKIFTWEEALNDPAGSYRSGFNLTNSPLSDAKGVPYPGTDPRKGAVLADLASRSRSEGWMGGTPWGGPGSPISGTWLHGGHVNEIPGVGPGRPLFTTNNMSAARFYAGEKHRPGEGAIHRLGLNLPKTADMNLLERVVNQLGVGPPDLYDAGLIHLADVDRVESRRMSFYDQVGWLGVNPTDYLYIQKVVEALKGKGFAGYSDYDGFLNTGGIPVALPFSNSSIKNLGAVPFQYDLAARSRGFALGGVVGAASGIPLGRYGVGNEIGHDGPGLWTVRGSNGAAVPMRRNIGGWLQRFKGRGLSPALALDAARWWGAHWPAQKMFASGGIAPGQGSGDTVPAMLTPGELILNRGEQSRLGGMLGMPGASAHALFGAISGRSSGRGGGMFAGGGVSDDWLAQAAPASAQGIFSQVLKAELAPTIKVKPKIVADPHAVNVDQLRQAVVIALQGIAHFSLEDSLNYVAGKGKADLVSVFESLVGPLSKAAKKGIADPVGAAIAGTIKTTQQELNAYTTQEAQTISGLKQNVGDLQTSLSDQIKQTALDVQSAVDSAKQNLTGLASSVSSFIDSYIDKPLQNEQQKLTAQQNKLALTRLGQSVLLPGGHTLSSDPTKGLAQLRSLARKNPATRLAINDFISQQYEPAALAVKQDRATSLKAYVDRRINDLTYLANTGKINAAQFEAGIKAVLRRAGFSPGKAQSLLGVGGAGVFGEQENAAFAQARVNASGPQRPGSGAVGPLVRPLDVLHRDQREIHRITRQIGDAQIALQKEIATSTKKTAAATAKLQSLQEQQARHQGSSSDRNNGKANQRSNAHSGTTR